MGIAYLFIHLFFLLDSVYYILILIYYILINYIFPNMLIFLMLLEKFTQIVKILPCT